MSSAMYHSGVDMLSRGGIDWENDEVRVLLASPEYVPNQMEDRTVQDAIGLRELRSNGTYNRGGQKLPGRSVDSRAPGQVMLHAGSVEWTVTGEFRWAVVATADGQLIAYSDLGYQRVTNAPVRISYQDAGVAHFDVAPIS